MSIAGMILRTYVAPRAVITEWLAAPRHEGRALAMLIGACAAICLSVLPFLLAQPGDAPPQARVGAAIFAWLAVAPLAFYGIAGVIQGTLHVLGIIRDGYHVRLALFWALLAAAPLWLLNGAGMVMPVPAVQTTMGAIAAFGVLCLVIFCQAALPRRADDVVTDGGQLRDRH
jgi:hypothetical protein